VILAGSRRLRHPGRAGDRLHHRDQHAQHVAAAPTVLFRQPGLLHAAQGDGGGRVAGQHHQATVLLKQPFHPRDGEVEDVVGAARAIGRRGVVAKVDETPPRLRRRQRPQHRQAAMAGIEHADHRPSVSLHQFAKSRV